MTAAPRAARRAGRVITAVLYPQETGGTDGERPDLIGTPGPGQRHDRNPSASSGTMAWLSLGPQVQVLRRPEPRHCAALAGPVLSRGPVRRPTATEDAPPQPSRRTKRPTVRTPSRTHRLQRSTSRALAAPHPGRPPGSPDRSNAADAGGPSCYPDDLPKGYHTASRGRSLLHAPDPTAGPLDTARSGYTRPTG
jgi:hypothetical protein